MAVGSWPNRPADAPRSAAGWRQEPTGDEADSKASNCMRWLYGKRERISVSRSILAAA